MGALCAAFLLFTAVAIAPAAPLTPGVDDPGCGPAATTPVPDALPIRVSMPPAAPFTVGAIPAAMWRRPPVADPTWRLNFQGLMWMRPLARRAALDGQTGSLAALVRQAVLFHRQNPDPRSVAYGWDEGTALRRLEAENCLYALTRSAGLIPGMTADARVLTGSRYYGPPYHPVHNHGLMANLQLIRAGELLRLPAWRRTAMNRILTEAPLAFSRRGFSLEQSSMYQLTNATLWDQAAARLTGYPAAAARIRATVRNAYGIFSFMTEPDGKISQIGDSDEIAGRPRDLKGNRAVRDDQAGWVIGRWGWTDRDAPHYTIRYGPARRAHGHEDRAGGVTWSTRGVRVLVGPGRFSYDRNNRFSLYQTRPDAQNVAVPAGGAVRGGTSAITSTFAATSHVFVVRDTVYGKVHTRGVTVNATIARMVVSDSFRGVGRWRQHWHLDPDWVRLPGAALAFRHPAGRRLTVTTTGRVTAVPRGSPAGPAGWHFPRFQVREAAYQIMVDNVGAWTTTTFRVT
ncbi:hypothetical protein [Actinoplanes sp. NBRC 103695]|uniref:hypothetical protein n=1 Tax=Actinoplanes sp. NBRC 103695 TaxID=3032202 RepID=UPI0024A28E34|nr:hypothetical protein [Actinoplanes sp. NBRC 103695]GLZ00123.1 hypothetical protein Acsp02_73750 [Actinoplanes sp. NBRC 103695]